MGLGSSQQKYHRDARRALAGEAGSSLMLTKHLLCARVQQHRVPGGTGPSVAKEVLEAEARTR